MMQVLVVQHGVVPAVGILECLVVSLVAPRYSKKLLLPENFQENFRPRKLKIGMTGIDSSMTSISLKYSRNMSNV
jgi:hypothetical protein